MIRRENDVTSSGVYRRSSD